MPWVFTALVMCLKRTHSQKLARRGRDPKAYKYSIMLRGPDTHAGWLYTDLLWQGDSRCPGPPNKPNLNSNFTSFIIIYSLTLYRHTKEDKSTRE